MSPVLPGPCVYGVAREGGEREGVAEEAEQYRRPEQEQLDMTVICGCEHLVRDCKSGGEL